MSSIRGSVKNRRRVAHERAKKMVQVHLVVLQIRRVLEMLDSAPHLRINALKRTSQASIVVGPDFVLAFSLIDKMTQWKLLLDWYMVHAPLLRFEASGEARALLRILVYHLKIEKLRNEIAEEVMTQLTAYDDEYPTSVQGLIDAMKDIDLDSHFSDYSSSTYLSIKYSHPKWMVERLLRQYPKEEVICVLEANNRPDPLTFRAYGVDRRTLIEELQEEGVSARPTYYHPRIVSVTLNRPITSLRAFLQGHFQPQGEMPAFMVDLLGAESGDTILDMCCLPGTKTAFISESMKYGRIDAVDVDPPEGQRFGDMRRNLSRLNCTLGGSGPTINYVSSDGRTFNAGTLYDRILLDAPCSSLGILSRHSDARWNRRPEDVDVYISVQKELLSNCARMLRTGGTLVYSTCTLEPGENEAQVGAFLAQHKNFESVPIDADKIPGDLITNDGSFYYPRKWKVDQSIQTGFAAVLRRIA